MPNNQPSSVGNQSTAAVRLGITLAEVKLAKAMGCGAFKSNNTVWIEELAEFIKTPAFIEAAKNSVEDEDWEKRLKRAKALREELRLRKEKGELWDSELVRRSYAVGDEALASTLRRWLESDQPPLVEGKDAAHVLKVNRKFLDELCAELRASRDNAVATLSKTTPDAEENEQDD